MRVRGLDLVRQLDVVELGAADDPLLLCHRQRIPGRKVVQIPLDQHIAAAGEVRVLFANHGRRGCCCANRVLRAVDEPEQVALIEGLEAVHLVDYLGAPAQALNQPLRKLEAQIGAVGPNVEQ